MNIDQIGARYPVCFVLLAKSRAVLPSSFFKGVVEASNSAIDNTKKILALQSIDQALLWEKKLSSPLARVVLNQLYYTPVISIPLIEKQFNVSYPTAAQLIKKFVEIGILHEVTGQKRAKRFVYSEYLKILSEGTTPL